MHPTRTALATSANKGIGYDTARQLGGRGLIVLIGARALRDGPAPW